MPTCFECISNSLSSFYADEIMAAVSLAHNSIGVGSPAGSSCVAALSIDHLVLINGRVPLAPRGWVPRCNWIDPLLLPVKYCPLKPLCR
jgi:hypothetical protein